MGDKAILLNKNIIKVDKSNLKDGITPIIKQKPNRKILGLFRFHLGVYNLFNRGDSTKFKTWVKETIGEKPVLLDTALTKRSNLQVRQYMQNTGYFHALVRDTTLYISKHKANVKYIITTNQPYTVLNTFYSISDPMIEALVLADSTNTEIKRGANYDTGILQKERERVTTLLKNNGYYFFNHQYLSFKIDSSLKRNQVDIYLIISNPYENISDTTLTAKIQNHKQFTLNKIYVRTDFDPLNINESKVSDTVNFNNYIFLSASKYFRYRPSALIDHIFLKSGELYRLSDHEDTYRGLGDLGNFRFINIKFETDSEAFLKNEYKLNCFVYLTPLLKQSYKVELEGTHNGGNLGAAGNFIYSNRNTFKGAETFDLKLKTAIEDIRNTSVDEEKKILLFNTYEIGPEASLNIPRVLRLFKKFDSKSVIRSSNLTVSYNLQQRPEFFRRIADFSAGYIRKKTNYSRFQVYPVEINFVSVRPDPEFKQKLDDIGDPALTSSYEDHLVTNGRLSYIITTQELNKLKNFIFLRINFEAAGNTLRLSKMISDALAGRKTKDDSSYVVLGNPYAQYVKPDLDFRIYHVLDLNNTVVYRIALGVGLPYLNSISLPFEKSFFAGGANDLRAFHARSIGPGSYTQEESIQQTGEIKINGNIEYRFDIFRILQGAFFADAGNVWLTKEDANRPGGKIEWNRFYKEIAIGGGLGFRFNFTFFIFRFDLGYKFRDPTLPEADRWVYKKLHLNDFVGNFGIGYPF